MKTSWLFLLATGAGFSLHAQFYAPETEYHDIAQRTFPVEAARVLAWQRGPDAADIAEITYRVATTPARETHWIIAWRNAAGATVRERNVRYEEALLTRGAEFFREVFRQLCGEDWRPEIGGGEAHATYFWDGARRAGISRAEAIAAARRFVAENARVSSAEEWARRYGGFTPINEPGRLRMFGPEEAARLAGLLVHGSLPILASQLTIDSVTLSRAASWLCLAEAMSGRQADEGEWASVLFLAGREGLAGDLWRALPAQDPVAARPAERFWEAMLRKPSVDASFEFAARREHRQHAMAAMAYHARCDRVWGKILGDQLYLITPSLAPIGDEHRELLREYEYAPLLEEFTPALGCEAVGEPMRAWLRLLDGFTDGAVDVARLRQWLPAQPRESTPEQTAAHFAPLLAAAHARSGAGPLRPVAVASTADVLGFGWEVAAVQLGGQAHRLDRSDPKKGAAFRQRILALCPDMRPFFSTSEKSAALAVDAGRLQFVTAPDFTPPREAARPQRCWLWKDGAVPNIKALLDAGAKEADIAATIERMIGEGGQLAIGRVADRFVEDDVWNKIEALGLAPRLTEAMPSSSSARLSAVTRRLRRDGDAFREAQVPDLMPAKIRSLADRIHPPLKERTPEARMTAARMWMEQLHLPDLDAGTRLATIYAIAREMESLPVEVRRQFLRPIPDEIFALVERHSLAEWTSDAVEYGMELVQEFAPADVEPALRRLAAHPDRSVSGEAMMALRARGVEVTLSQPIEFRFTALDGREVDLEKLRGKVVLLNFWASWCAPCKLEMPHILAAYKKFHEHGLEVVGISLDDDKAALEQAINKLQLPWPQFYGGKRAKGAGWSDPLVRRVGLVGVPHDCLLDRKGMLRHTTVRGEKLADAIERLLAE